MRKDARKDKDFPVVNANFSQITPDAFYKDIAK